MGRTAPPRGWIRPSSFPSFWTISIHCGQLARELRQLEVPPAHERILRLRKRGQGKCQSEN